ncbi:MAG: Asp-tRNA(Asn)/Glu-tRNA(Gln) amidotransferase subunit GatA [Deltaproteobacteria bacterium]|nr:Asp-tRNA(Asn)/Glu-tRNA(Gln) amidotransferase subunit GatA [Deltaproteobacteria bacterium]
MSINELHKELASGKVSAVELAKSYLETIRKTNPSLNSFITVCEENALKQAAKADERLKSKKNVTPLTGIPIGIKDLLITKGIRTTCASKILSNYVPQYNATVVDKLENAGAVILGKLNMDEFAMGSSNEHSAFGPVKNPHNEKYVPGGSSGGSAAAVASNQCAAALGTDTGGSIRQPASMCGCVGIKPTYGRVSRFGLVAFASSLDQIGPITKNVTDAAIMLKAISGHDNLDSTTLKSEVPDYAAALKEGLNGIKIGVPKEYFIKGISKEVAESVNQAIKKLEKNGAEIVDISLPHTEYAVACYYIIAPAEASANLARYDGIRYGHRAKSAGSVDDLFRQTRTEGFGPEVTLRIMLGTYVLSSGYYDAYYRKAQCVRTLIKNDFAGAFAKVDAIVSPTAPTPAFKIGEKTDDPLQMYLADIFTTPVNLAGLPAISIPCGASKDRLPIGMQIIGKHLDEAKILNLAYNYELIA